ncbi:hypothetical protein [Sphaerisporangium sp. NPDC051011]|uniref:hypothetical protein n=1 Tax=Sphaerisporangium sp. NPDC051011 TaxID=3155792 RepID=UPI0033DFF649
MIQQLDHDQVGLVLPALAASAAVLDVGGAQDQVAVIRGICRLDRARFAGVVAFDDAVETARVQLASSSVGTLWDAQTAEAALRRRAPILTLDHGRWKEAVHETAGALAVIEVADLDD